MVEGMGTLRSKGDSHMKTSMTDQQMYPQKSDISSKKFPNYTLLR